MIEQECVIDLLPAFALGCLDPDAHECVGDHLASCVKCRLELDAYNLVADRIGQSATPVAPPLHVKQRVMSRILPEGDRDGVNRLQRWLQHWFASRIFGLPLAAVASILLVVALGSSNLIWYQKANRLEGRLLSALDVVHLQHTTAAPSAYGALVIEPDGLQGLLIVNRLPNLPAARQYQLWLIKNGRRTSGGVFSVDPNGKARLKIVPSTPLFQFEAFGITIEPFGGSSGPTGDKVLGGKLSI